MGVYPAEPVRAPAAPVWAAAVGLIAAASESNLAQTTTLVWTLVAIGAAGAIVTFAIMVYALLKFRDPATRRRRYG